MTELSGSEWAHVVHGHLGGRPPRVDLAAEQALSSLLVEATGVVTSSHDLSDGGLAQALVESCLRADVGVDVELAGDPFVALFSESTARVLVTVAPDDEERLRALAERHGVPVTSLGRTTRGGLAVTGLFDVGLEELRATWSATLPLALA